MPPQHLFKYRHTKKNLIGKVDGVLIADDYEIIIKILKLLEAGLPVYIDKPISISLKNFEKIYKNETYRDKFLRVQ